MTPDCDTLARDLLTLPALVEAPEEVVRGLVLRNPWGATMPVRSVDRDVWRVGMRRRTPADLHAAGWRVDLDAPATAGVLLGLLGPDVGFHCGDPKCPTPWLVQLGEHEGEGATLAEAAARALVEVAHYFGRVATVIETELAPETPHDHP